MDIGDEAYTNSLIRFSQLPPVLYGADWIRTPEQTTGNGATFNLNSAGDVFVAISSKPNKLPEWLKDYSPAGFSIQTDENGGNTMAVYKKRFAADATVKVGNKDKCIIAVLPISTLAPATDLRPVVSIKATAAELQGNGVVRDTIGSKNILRFNANGGEITFDITPGVGNKYDLRFKYYNTSERTLTAKMELRAADGTLMKQETLEFKPTRKGKSGTVATDTGTSINAGNYKVTLQAIDAEGLMISGLEMQ
jgi:hypothetical protein